MGTTTTRGRREDVTVYVTASELALLRKIQREKSSELCTPSLSAVVRHLLADVLRKHA